MDNERNLLNLLRFTQPLLTYVAFCIRNKQLTKHYRLIISSFLPHHKDFFNKSAVDIFPFNIIFQGHFFVILIIEWCFVRGYINICTIKKNSYYVREITLNE